MKKKIERSLENLNKAIKRLCEYLEKPIEDDRDKSGVIQAFEFSFELVWKTIQKKGEEAGVRVPSPRSALEYAQQAGLIDAEDEQTWLQMLEDRNLTSHTYVQELADEIFNRIRKSYLKLFLQLKGRLGA